MGGMKTVKAELRGCDRDLGASPGAEPLPLGRANSEVCARYLLGLPRTEDGSASLVLTGRDGMWLTFSRRDAGGIVRLSMKDGETDYRLPEIAAVERIRLFVAHHGEETELTEEFRLPEEMRRRIAARESRIDEERKARLAGAAPRRSFVFRPYRAAGLASGVVGLVVGAGAAVLLSWFGTAGWVIAGGLAGTGVALGLILAFRSREVVVDRRRGVLEIPGGEAPIALASIESADADEHGNVLIGPRPEAGRRVLRLRCPSPSEAAALAEAVNDAVGLPEGRRKLLRYRRAGR